MSVSARARRVAIVLGVVLAVVTAPVWAQALSGLVPVTGSVPMETNSGLTVTVGGASDLAGSDFLNDDTLRIETDQGNLTAEAIASAEATVQAGDITGPYTNVTAIDAASAQILLAPDDKANLTVSGGITDAAWRDYGTDTGQTAAVISGSGSSTITAYGLPSDTRVWAIDAQTGQLVAQDVTDANGEGIFSFNASTGSHAVALPNGELKQSWSDTDRHLRFVTTDVDTTLPASAVAGDGLNVTVTGTNALATDGLFPYANTVDVRTGFGSVEFTASGTAAATVADTDLEGPFTNLTDVDASSTTITADPGDKAQLSINGDADAVAWSDYAPDDGQADAVISGPDGTSSEVTFYGLEAGQTYTAWSPDSGTPIDVAQANDYGQVTFTVDHSSETLYLQEGDQSRAPGQDNPSPTGDLDTEPSELSVEVTDEDFPDDEVAVTIDLDGTQIHTETVTGPSTVTTTIPSEGLTGGEHTWTVNTTDRFGNTRIEQYIYRTPAELEIRNETNPSELITDPINATVRFYGPEQVYERQTDTGTLNLTGLPITQPLVVEVEASADYTGRTVYFNEGDIYEQQTVYLLNNSLETVAARFTLNDPTGTYDENSVLYISRPINDSGTITWQTIHADQFGVEGVTADLQSDQRYRLRITDADGGTSQDLGPYRTDVSETVEITPASPGVSFDTKTDGIEFGAELDNTTLTWSYADLEGETDELTVWIHERGNPDNQLVANETYLNVQNASGQTFLTVNESEKEWAVNFVVDDNGGENTYQTVVTKRPGLVPDGLADSYRKIIAIGSLLLFAGALSVLNVGVGAIVFGVAAGLLWFTGWLGGVTSGVAIVAYMLVAVLVYIMKGGRL